MKKTFFIYLILLFNFNSELFSQRGNSNKKQLSYNENLYNSIDYRLIGPFRGGRSGTVSGVVGDDNTYYMGTAGGGVWKTTDAGNTWKSISDGYFGGSIGSIAHRNNHHRLDVMRALFNIIMGNIKEKLY